MDKHCTGHWRLFRGLWVTHCLKLVLATVWSFSPMPINNSLLIARTSMETVRTVVQNPELAQ